VKITGAEVEISVGLNFFAAEEGMVEVVGCVG